MNRIQSINPDRLAWCCTEYGITPSELASKLNISTTSMERLMSGEDGVTFNQFRRIAEYFGRGLLFFLETSPVQSEHVYTPHFRTLANKKPQLSIDLKKLIERVENQREIYRSLLEDLDEEDRLRFTPPRILQGNPKEAARTAREWLKLKETNNFETYRASLENKGILIFRSNGFAGKWQISKDDPILGFALYDKKCPVIVIKKQPWPTQQSFTLMHELGHLLIHKASSIDDEGDMLSHRGAEREVNAFAGQLLVPDDFLASIRDAGRPENVSGFDDWLEEQRKAWGVSGEVILRRLLDAGRLPQDCYDKYREWRANLPALEAGRGSRMYRYREPKHVFGDPFVRTVLDALNARNITLAKASGYLDGLKIRDLHRLEEYYASL